MAKSTISVGVEIPLLGGPLCGEFVRVLDGMIPAKVLSLSITPRVEVLPKNWTRIREINFWEYRYTEGCDSTEYALSADGNEYHHSTLSL